MLQSLDLSESRDNSANCAQVGGSKGGKEGDQRWGGRKERTGKGGMLEGTEEANMFSQMYDIANFI